MSTPHVPKPAPAPAAATDPRLVNSLRPEDKDEFYHDILDGLAVYLDSAYILDILNAIREFPMLRLGNALNMGQVASKKWVLDTLACHGLTDFGGVYVLGGWYGVLCAMLLNDPRFTLDKVTSVDIDPRCGPVAEALNRSGVDSGRFESVTADAYDLDYRRLSGDGARELRAPALVVNTSCEHLVDLDRWHRMIPPGTLLALQSNDYYDCAEHYNCVPDLESFRRQVPLSEVLYQGEMELKKYTRFMLIGRK